MDAISDPFIPKVVCMKAAQVGWTEIINNTIGHFIDNDPCPILIIQPSLEMAETWSKDRFSPMVRDTPAIRNKLADAKGRDVDNTIRQKVFKGGRLTVIGANAPAGLASRPIRIVLADEVDRYPQSAGMEGNPLKLAEKRQDTFWNRKTLIGSTPTRKDFSSIYSEFELSDQRRFFVPCPDCGHRQTLRWENVRWDKADDGRHLHETAHYVCEDCGSIWDDLRRWAAISHGEWRATKEGEGLSCGFHIPCFISPWVRLTTVVKEFLDARKDPEDLQVWVNTRLGEPWEELAEKVDGTGLGARCESYITDSLPFGVKLLTAGVDTQQDRLELQVHGYGAHEECWVIQHEIINGDPAGPQVWKELDQLLLYHFVREDGRKMMIKAVCIDTGGHHAEAVYSYCRSRRKRRVFPIKGIAGPRPIWPRRPTKAHNKIDDFYGVGVDTAKDAIYGRLKITNAGPGYIHFPVNDSIDQKFFDQLTSEQVVTRKREGIPYRVWVLPSGRRNEALDTFVYALAARRSIPIKIKDNADVPMDLPPPIEEVAESGELVSEKETPAVAARPVRVVRPAQHSSWMRPRSNWFDRRW